eukprot:7207511-Heterocapsa_arctica.AAC.1
MRHGHRRIGHSMYGGQHASRVALLIELGPPPGAERQAASIIADKRDEHGALYGLGAWWSHHCEQSLAGLPLCDGYPHVR